MQGTSDMGPRSAHELPGFFGHPIQLRERCPSSSERRNDLRSLFNKWHILHHQRLYHAMDRFGDLPGCSRHVDPFCWIALGASRLSSTKGSVWGRSSEDECDG